MPPFDQLFSPFKPGAKEATESEITHTPPASKDPRFYRPDQLASTSKPDPVELLESMCNDPGIGNSLEIHPGDGRNDWNDWSDLQPPKRVQYLYKFRSAFAVPQLDRIEAAQAEEFAGGE